MSLLSQILQQLTGFQNNTYPRPQQTPAFSPTVAILFVNAFVVSKLRDCHCVCILCNAGAGMDPSIYSNVGRVDRRPTCPILVSVHRQPEMQLVARNWADAITSPHLRVPVLNRSHINLERHGHCPHNCCRAHWIVVLGTDFLPHHGRCLPISHPQCRTCGGTCSTALSGCHLVVELVRDYSGSDEESGPGRLSFSGMRRKHRSTWTSLRSPGCSSNR